MTLRTFSFPLPETRFFKASNFIYKFKIRGDSSYSGEEVMEGNCFRQEMEDIIRTVLGNLDSLQPFFSTHFNIHPYKKKWEGLSNVMCKHDKKRLRAYPFILILHLERKAQNGKQAEKKLSSEIEREQHTSGCEPPSKRCKGDSPLEEAILQDLINDMEAESEITMVGRLHMNFLHAEGKVNKEPGQVDKPGAVRCVKHQLKSGVDMTGESGSPGDTQPETVQDMGEEGGGSAPSERSGILTRLASCIFPFSLFFRDP